jgi:hypothetical protein
MLEIAQASCAVQTKEHRCHTACAHGHCLGLFRGADGAEGCPIGRRMRTCPARTAKQRTGVQQRGSGGVHAQRRSKFDCPGRGEGVERAMCSRSEVASVFATVNASVMCWPGHTCWPQCCVPCPTGVSPQSTAWRVEIGAPRIHSYSQADRAMGGVWWCHLSIVGQASTFVVGGTWFGLSCWVAW